MKTSWTGVLFNAESPTVVSKMKQFTITDAVSRGICSGCGACAVVDDGIRVERDGYGVMQAKLPAGFDPGKSKASVVCPFSDEAPTEDEHGKKLWGAGMNSDPRVGHFMSLYAGRVEDQASITQSSSGGLTSWICAQLLGAGIVDGVLHVAKKVQPDSKRELFEFSISTGVEQLMSERKSQYYSVSASDVLNRIRGDGKRYAFVGVPCFIKAIRNLQNVESEFRVQIPVLVGLVCGHLKSSAFAELMAWQVGVNPRELQAVDFRVKDPNRLASRYAFAATNVAGKTFSKTSSQLLGGNWGHATMQLTACNYCDDIFAELADVSLGDAWIPRFENNWQGTNVLVVRNAEIDAILRAASDRKEIYLEKLPIDELSSSQDGNFRHRRMDLQVRLADDMAADLAVPKKRMSPDVNSVPPARVELLRLRRKMAEVSHAFFLDAKKSSSLNVFVRGMRPYTRKMDGMTKPPLLVRAIRKLLRLLRKRQGL